MDYKEQIDTLNAWGGALTTATGRQVGMYFREAAHSISDLLARAEAAEARVEKAERERDAAVADLIRAEQAADETCQLLDNEVHPICDYALYLSLHDSVSDIVHWGHDDVWRKKE